MEDFVWSAIGAAIGVAGSLLLLRSFGTLLFGVTPDDVSTYAMVLTLLVRGRGAWRPTCRPAVRRASSRWSRSGRSSVAR